MKYVLKLLMVVFMFGSLFGKEKENGNIYVYSAKDIDGKVVNFADYKNKVLLIVNTASECGFTPQYKGLEQLYKNYKSKGLVIIGFPCNQFGSQEPGNSKEIKSFCEMNYSVTFPIMEKIDVNGENTHPIYKFLKSSVGGTITDDIKWNFAKFLVGKDGKVIERYGSQTTPESLEETIKKLL